MSGIRVSVVGLGKMGSALTRRLLAQGVAVTVWNRTPSAVGPVVELGAVAVGDLHLVWEGALAVMTCLADDAALEAVCLGEEGLLARAPSGGILVETSTVSPRASEAVAKAAASRAVRYLRCPFSGNPAIVEAGDATFIASGDLSALEGVREVLSLVSSKVTWLGESEQARVMKLAINAMVAAAAEMLAEVVVLSEAYGIERKRALEVVGNSVVASQFAAYKAPALVARQYEATFTSALMQKDLDLAHDAASEAGLSLPLTELVRDLIADTCKAGLGQADFLALLPRLQAASGLPSDVPVSLP